MDMSGTNVVTQEELNNVLVQLAGILPRRIIDELRNKLANKPLNREQFVELIKILVNEYYKMLVDPGEAIGIVTAQSVGEPSTQMILRSFHFAGLREFSMALGLPRMIELVDARRKPSVPMMTIYLDEEHRNDPNKAQEVAYRIQLTTIENVARSVEIDYINSQITIEIDEDELRQRGLSMDDVRKVVERIKGKGAQVEFEGNVIRITLENADIIKLRRVRDKIMQTRLAGIKNVKKTLVRYKDGEWIIETEGTNLEAVLTLDGVDYRRTISNDIHEVAEVLGIEAARTVIMRELKKVLDQQGLDTDIRHLMLISDVMTWTGRVRQVGRHGVVGEKESPLARAAFEVTVKNLVEASIRGENEQFRGVVESVLAGKYIPIGTGIVQLLMEFE
ncbi:MAG: DNA-directed RNA polymerase subunit A'' [Vulcanisaeta sp.]|jgi:DNA-directed RNA polymerase subunit A"|nr:DNA-directed RNA polymerase subunit A'' [Vulcanisaeta sp.]MCG2866354.1 DNA-directed RNA polymerase subunit A'' [Vulcanisaeta sp.]MCG2885653.1 DNA-directed RNA polymerase subunit A'' [Vulcanisaeta sp.]MDT7969266.1 DNA-directed RNA polymerase subunit A'' [Vulcanisaeta sp.]